MEQNETYVFVIRYIAHQGSNILSGVLCVCANGLAAHRQMQQTCNTLVDEQGFTSRHDNVATPSHYLLTNPAGDKIAIYVEKMLLHYV